MIDPMQQAPGMMMEPELAQAPGLGAIEPEMQATAELGVGAEAEAEAAEFGGPMPAPQDPVSLALDLVLDTPGPEAIRRVYQLAISAARAKARIKESAHRLDARTFHDLLSASPEARYADALVSARRRLDTLAQERRRLNLEMVKAREAGREPGATNLEIQIAACSLAMEQVAGGVLLFLALPSMPSIPQATPQPTPAPSPTSTPMAAIPGEQL